MQVTETNTEGLKREYKILVPAAEIEDKVAARLTEIGQTASLPGFRPGKVPMAYLRKRFKPAVMGEVLEKLINESTSQTLTDRKLRPAAQPKVEITAFDEGKDLEFSVALEIVPEIALADLSGISLERMKAKVPDAEVDRELAALAHSRATAEPIAEARPAAKGDVVSIDFVGKVDGEVFPGGDAKDLDLMLGSNTFIPGFEDQLVGAKAGESRAVTVTFPEAYHVSTLAGKAAVFDVKLNAIKAMVEPKVDDDLAKTVGLENLDQLRTKQREIIEANYAAISRQHLTRGLLDELNERHVFPIPQVLLDSEFESIWKTVEEAKKNGTLDPDDKDKSDEELKDYYRSVAERRVRLALVLSEIGRVNNIKVGKEDLQRLVFNEARRYPGQEREAVEHFTKNPEIMQQFQSRLFEEKTVDFILELVQVADREVTPEELMAEPEAEVEKKPAKAKKKAKAESAVPDEAEKKPAKAKKAAKADDAAAAEPAKKPAKAKKKEAAKE